MFNKQLILKLKKILNEKNLTYGEFYFFLASFMMYFTKPLINEEWNNFPYKIKNKIISLEEGLLMTDEEKNFKDLKVLKDNTRPFNSSSFINILLETKKQLILQFPTLYKNKQSYVIIKQYKENVLFPYSKINDLKDSIKISNSSLKIKNKKLTNDLIKKHIEKLEKNINYCKMCNNKKKGKKKLPFKTLNKHQTFYFCSLECLDNYNL